MLPANRIEQVMPAGQNKEHTDKCGSGNLTNRTEGGKCDMGIGVQVYLDNERQKKSERLGFFLDLWEETEGSGNSVFLVFKIKTLTDSVLKFPPLFSGCTANAKAAIFDPSLFETDPWRRRCSPPGKAKAVTSSVVQVPLKVVALYLNCCLFSFFPPQCFVFFIQIKALA